MRGLAWSSLGVLSFLVFSGCSDPAADPDGGSIDASIVDGAIGDAMSADAAQVDAGSDDAGNDADGGAIEPDGGASDGGQGASVRWITETEPRTIDGDVGLDFAFQYEVVVDDRFAYQLAIETCNQLAGMTEECHTDPLGTALGGTSFLRTGIDPSMYAVGENHYRYRLILTRDDVTVDEDVLEVVLTVTSCTMCVGSSAAP